MLLVVFDEAHGFRNAYASAHIEKMMRAELKADIERFLTRETVVIADSLNYIKVNTDTCDSQTCFMEMCLHFIVLGISLRVALRCQAAQDDALRHPHRNDGDSVQAMECVSVSAK